MRHKKVLIIANLSGFLWKFELGNVHILQELGYEVHYASNICEKGYDFDLDEMQEKGIIFHQIDIARSPYMFKMNSAALKQILKIIDEEGIALIHCHTPVGGVLGRIAGLISKRKPKVIYTAHGFHFYKGAPIINNVIYQFVERLLAPLTDIMILINKEDYNAARTMHLRNKGKIYQIPGIGLDLSYFSPVSKSEKQVYRRSIEIGSDVFFILSVGELNQNKNHKIVIKALKKIDSEHLTDVPIVYGICGDGFFKEDIRRFARDIGLGEKIHFFGYQKEIKDYYAAADLTVFPSLREGLGMSGLESLAMGVPVVAADNRGTREYMIDGKNGYVFNPEDVDGCAEGILKICGMSEEDRNKMSVRCIESIQKFSKEKTTKIMKDIYSYIDREIS